jgi:N-acetylglucosamine kinase-like BadF-type ATPase
MKFVLGIDGGQTATKAVLADETGRLLGAGAGGPANHIHEPGGPERVRNSLKDAIRTAREAAGLPDAPIAHAYLGMTGGSEEMAEICRSAVDAERMTLGHDSLIALYSVTFGGPGIAIIGGTGSVGFGRTAEGRTARAGGWGYIFGDEGSAYWIGRIALNTASRAFDGIAQETTVTKRILEHFQAANLWEVHRKVYSGEIGRPEIAALAELVDQQAGEGDRAALEILERAAQHLAALAVSVGKRLEWEDKPVQVGMVGGVFRSIAVAEWFPRHVHRGLKQVECVRPRIAPAVAAVLLALEEIGSPADSDAVSRIEAASRLRFAEA